MAANYGQRFVFGIKKKYAVLDIALIAPKQKGFRSNEY